MIAVKIAIINFILITLGAYIAIETAVLKTLVSPILDLKFNLLLQFIQLV